MNQCYTCDSSKSSGQGDVDEPTKCGTISSCQLDGVTHLSNGSGSLYRIYVKLFFKDTICGKNGLSQNIRNSLLKYLYHASTPFLL